ncbi:MAG: histidine kinase [Bacteroidales bacterium]|nr:histidine kinase [Bacteroidales bacterium]
MKSYWIEVIIHTLFWVSTAWLITSSFSIESHEIEIIDGIETINIVRNNGLYYQLLFCVFISVIAFYINAWLIFNLNRVKTDLSPILFSALAFVIVLILIYVVIEFRPFNNVPPIPKQIAFGIVTFYFSLSIAYGLARLWMYNNQRQQQLILEKKQAELTLLRNQLQPHFLFNALNNLLSMVNPSENPKLINSFGRLSQLLRYVIEGTNTEKVSIEKEIEFQKNYIELQMLRFNEDEVQVKIDVRGEHDTQFVEPGLFIVFVENAFKYGTEPEKLTRIEIEFDLSKTDLVQFKIKNKIMMKNSNGVGTGIETTRKRLDLIYPNKHRLTISSTDYFIVQLTINTK